MCILQNRRAAFAEAFYRFHERRTARMLLWVGVQVAIALLFTTVGFWQLFHGEGVLIPGLFAASFLVMFVASICQAAEQFKVRVVPYFEKQLGDVATCNAGKSLLWHSRDLDQLADYLSIRPLSTFASGDDLIQGEEVCFHNPNEALPTVEKLLSRSKMSRFPKELISDLTKLRDALKIASEKDIGFCLVLREGTGPRSHETPFRKGSFV